MRLDLSVLNPEQREAVTAGSGPLLVLAGAGSGKTRVITYRIAHLVRSGMRADRILGITFTNKAAREMGHRLDLMYPDLDPAPWISTFHSLGLSILREEHKRIGYRRNFPIYDDSDARDVLTEELRSIVGLTQADKNMDGLRRQISFWKSRFVGPAEALDLADDDHLYLQARVYSRYQDRLQGLNAVDFDDLIYRPVLLMREDSDAHLKWTQRFGCVLVDEYQDSNTAQYHFARLLAGPAENLTVVGDDDQSIYAFRGAEVEKILRFRTDFPKAKVVTLESNYRSVATVLDAANAVISNNSSRHPKTMRAVRGGGSKILFLELEDEAAEAEEVVTRCQQAFRRGIRWKDQAILIRSAIQARPIEEKLRFFQIPYTVVGTRSFFDRKEVKDALAYLRLLAFPHDDIAALRILNTPRRGWGKGSREKLDAYAREHGISVLDALARVDEIAGVSSAAKEGGRELREALERARLRVETDAVGALRDLLEQVNYEQALRDLSGDALDYDFRRRSVESFVESIQSFEERKGPGRIGDFLSGLALDGRRSADSDETDELTLITFHGAKGLEFQRVSLIGIEENLIPHKRAVDEGGDRAVDEERRLFYVAMTRAMDELLLTRALTRRRFGKEVETIESRFAQEIPEELLVRKAVDAKEAAPVDEDARAQYMAAMRAKFS